MDILTESDPMVVVSLTSLMTNNQRIEIGRTEAQDNNPNPNFSKAIQVDYFFEEIQTLRFDVYDIDDVKGNLSEQDYIGFLECSLGQIVGEGGGSYSKPLKHPTQSDFRGIINIVAEELSSSKSSVQFTFRAQNLDRKNWWGFGSSDPFLQLSRENVDGTFSAFHKTEAIQSNINPSWFPFELSVSTICNGDMFRNIKLEVLDWNATTPPVLIGFAITNLQSLISHDHVKFNLIEPKLKATKKSYVNSGTLIVVNCTQVQRFSFLDFLSGGLDLNFVVAIDFTASNGAPSLPSSLHHFRAGVQNQYVNALTSVGRIINDYDTDKMYPALGFGAKFIDGTVSHEFALNGNYSDPYCSGIDGILAAYTRSLSTVELWGPTNFAPVVNYVNRMATASLSEGLKYFVLLIITDGEITDLAMTKRAIIAAADLPISIIIVGVGSADFSAMEVLDGDEIRLNIDGKYAARDIVQFVPMRDFVNKDVFLLAKAVLAELPDQVVEYMKIRNIIPIPGHSKSTSA